MQQEITSQRFISNLTKNTVALILAGGRGVRLRDLTESNSKPAVPFGGKFRIIDFPLSNCINSGIRRIGVATQYKSHSLIQHIQRGWGFLRGEFNEFVEIWPAQQRVAENWYKGTADAIFQNLDIIRNIGAEYILILAGDQVYKMDYSQMLACHVRNQADMTVACINVPIEEASGFGVIEVDESDRVIDFKEKPNHPNPLPNEPNQAFASMGIYVFNPTFLYEQLFRDAYISKSEHDFGKNIIPEIIHKYRVFAHRFGDSCIATNNGVCYWRDVGTVDAYWEANIELTKVTPELNLYDHQWPIWTYQEQLPPAKFVFNNDNRRGLATDSLVSGGCIISGARINQSVLFSNVNVHSYCEIENSVLMPDVNVGRHVKLNRAIVDTGVSIPDKMEIGLNSDVDRKRFYVSEKGVTLVTKTMLDQLSSRV
ncbi:MAG: glucose-1-phosphate adenylyltransferase [Betaproteobacteria bacterium]|nr:glucose-1-phosphate adenylyltransferase [Betaproteobacteria bacterium]